MSAPARSAPTYAGPRTWNLAREAYLSGETAKSVCRRLKLKESTLRARATRQGWTKRAYADSLVDPVFEQAFKARIAAREPPSPGNALSIAEAALHRALEALAAGRPRDAAALIKAGDAVGSFADFVSRLRQREEIKDEG